MKILRIRHRFVILALLTFSHPLFSVPQEIKRVILGIWSSQSSPTLRESPIFKSVELVLNHLGLYMDFIDIDSETPPEPQTPEWSKRYRGVLTFFSNEHIENSDRLRDWLQRFATTGLPWVSLGYFGFLEKSKSPELRKLFALYGAEFNVVQTDPLIIDILSVDPAMNFERKLGSYLSEYPPLSYRKSSQNDVKHWLKLRSVSAKFDSSAVFTSRHFSVAYGTYGLFYFPTETRRFWQLDPFRFLAEAFGLDSMSPIPDVSVLNGRRVFFSHIDGDGFHSVSKTDFKKYCGEVVETEILKKFRELPFGVSFIVAEVAEHLEGNGQLKALARDILSLPNVEPATHTYFHPLLWQKATLSYGPRKETPLNERREIVESADYINSNLAGEKRVTAVYWSGNTDPTENTLRLAREQNLANMNGGDGRFDEEFSSITYLAPLGIPVGNEFQVYSVNANENIYTNGWKEKLFAFHNVIQTFERTGTPRLLKPINPYFHFYSGELKVSLDALLTVFRWALKQPIAPVFPTDYVRSVIAFRNAKIYQVGSKHYRVTNAQHLRTLRIDVPNNHFPDLELSRGLLGFTLSNNALYLHLSPHANGEIEIILKTEEQRKIASIPRWHLVSVGGLVNQWIVEKNRVSVSLAPFTRGPLILGGARGEKAVVIVDGVRHIYPVVQQQISVPFEATPLLRRLEIRL